METNDAFWGSVILFAIAFGFPAFTIWIATYESKREQYFKRKKNNVEEEAETG